VKWRQPEREERQIALLWAVAAASALVLRPVWLAVAPLLPPCPFRVLTGVPCLTCGTTRAALAFFDARPLDALAANPLAALAGAAFAVGGLAAPLWAAAGLPVPNLGSPLARSTKVAIVVALLANWAWVIAVGS
jgi:hypothetical protein